MILAQQPFDYKIQHHIIDDNFLNKLYIKLNYKPISESVKVIIEKNNNIVYGYQYKLIEVNEGNNFEYDDCYIGQYIISFNSSYDIDCNITDSFFNTDKLGLIICIQYVHQEYTVEKIIEDNYEFNNDSINWSK